MLGPAPEGFLEGQQGLSLGVCGSLGSSSRVHPVFVPRRHRLAVFRRRPGSSGPEGTSPSVSPSLPGVWLQAVEAADGVSGPLPAQHPARPGGTPASVFLSFHPQGLEQRLGTEWVLSDSVCMNEGAQE